MQRTKQQSVPGPKRPDYETIAIPLGLCALSQLRATVDARDSPRANTADMKVATTNTATDMTLVLAGGCPGPWLGAGAGPEVIRVAWGRCRRRRPRCTLMLRVTSR